MDESSILPILSALSFLPLSLIGGVLVHSSELHSCLIHPRQKMVMRVENMIRCTYTIKNLITVSKVWMMSRSSNFSFAHTLQYSPEVWYGSNYMIYRNFDFLFSKSEVTLRNPQSSWVAHANSPSCQAPSTWWTCDSRVKDKMDTLTPGKLHQTISINYHFSWVGTGEWVYITDCGKLCVIFSRFYWFRKIWRNLNEFANQLLLLAGGRGLFFMALLWSDSIYHPSRWFWSYCESSQKITSRRSFHLS